PVGADERSYHGRAIFVGDGAGADVRAVAFLDDARSVAVFGPAAEVRRAIDVERRDEAGLGGDLVSFLHRAPTAKEGRPAARGAAWWSPPLRERARAAGLPVDGLGPAAWWSGALAVGDGADLGLVAGSSDEPA